MARLVSAGGTPSGSATATRDLPSKCQMTVEEGDRLTLETPGGGGWG